ncbi:MAG TPA: GNAT family N-acetyltransferase [Chitinophagaceae bacterium]|nr:GNAT family N-acetyltransferase [Chitinophagaceae bacterium]
MSTPAPIQYLTRGQLDPAKWDACIQAASNSLIYGYSSYLDLMAGQWDALVLGDYRAVMPLPWRKKWGIRYLYQPAFTQQLGVFSRLPLSGELVRAFLEAIPGRFRFAEIFLYYACGLDGLPRHVNLLVPLQEPYETISGRYTRDLRKNLRHAHAARLVYLRDTDPALIWQGYRHRTGPRVPHVTQKDYENFEKLCRRAADLGELRVRSVQDEQGLLCGSLFLVKGGRIYLMESFTGPRARKKAANHFLLDQVIREFAGSDLLLDFEGSDIPGIAAFKRNFGPVDQPYYFYRCNRLPRLVRWIKGS